MDYKYISDDIKKVVLKMNYYINRLPIKCRPCNEVYFLDGTFKEINTLLLEKSRDEVDRYKKYPVVLLRLPSSDDLRSGLNRDSLNIAIVNEADKNLSTDERIEQVFKPVLFPLYHFFLKAVKNVGVFVWEGELDSIPHQRIVRPYWGTTQSEEKDSNISSDPWDAIELVDLKINQTINNCII